MYIYLDIVPHFTCACCGRCCRNDWLVTVDEAGYERNRAFFAQSGRAGEFAAAFRPLAGRRAAGEFAAINKRADGGCWFLRKDNLCLLHREAGHEHLDEVCRLFPRYPIRTARGVEVTLSFSCPEVVRLAARTEPLEVVRAEEPPTNIEADSFTAEVFPRQQPQDSVLGFYFELERHFIDIMQCRGLTVAQRLDFLAATAAALDSLPRSPDTGRAVDRLIRGNYDRLDEAEGSGCAGPGPSAILLEHFFVNLIFKKVFYLHGLAGATRLLGALGRRLAAAARTDNLERVKAAVMAAEFEYCHNRVALQRIVAGK
ncbi:flagellin lysine-N-methylase [Anaeroselena agilis]|uniref:Flagellin lysine-N-methylase n=1 Tax=Anaeroselena agilis TaxID=3063788 RepID=A0ABU3NWS1_9FIRM|nr:flagellin lysine-N-methylase [Selenomonadales bacterium 4137-cl]